MKIPILIACTVTAFLVSGTALASIQEDVALCRAAFSEKTSKSIDNYKLKFENERGLSVRTLQITAIPNSFSGEKFRFSCTIDQNQVSNISFNTKET